MRTPHIQQFTKHNNRGQSVLAKCLLDWKRLYPEDKNQFFGPIVRYTWIVDGKQYEIMNMNDRNRVWLRELPDSTGFICFETEPPTNHNCVLLDAYGKERIRLRVPWELTGNPRISKELKMSFCDYSGPYENPKDGKMGKYGVTAWIAPPEGEGYHPTWRYYFELDYHIGKFLWGRQIRD